MKTTKICKTKAWFRSPFILSSQETGQAYSTAARTRTGTTLTSVHCTLSAITSQQALSCS